MQDIYSLRVAARAGGSPLDFEKETAHLVSGEGSRVVHSKNEAGMHEDGKPGKDRHLVSHHGLAFPVFDHSCLPDQDLTTARPSSG
ncbi:hypothetical protein [Sulfidibacter corallicola]|uniref:Uncharacterized protein n=1 Tax=Sulfidibacter corallicola TaxID=2818388 RepID=A0A8A4TQE5_SULCO|nr:hypothetical protein [Sulfidibacter corallicola]QTD51763.1 hypothetical protein J3U87_04775 [Sulfidibacter corallicola]